MARITFQCLILIFLIQRVVLENKYSKESNENIYKLDKPFRMQKLNNLWEKATKKLDFEQINQLFEDLKHQDKEELELKRIKSDNQDRDGSKEAEVRRQLKMILKKYQLDHDEQLDSVLTADRSDQSATMFKDVKLDKLWKKIHQLDLTEDQLTMLKEEFRRYENKMYDYQRLVAQYNDKDKNLERQNLENHINWDIDDDGGNSEPNGKPKPDSNMDEMQNKIQEKHFELKNEFKRISDMVYSKEAMNFKGDFEEEKAARLWQMALKAGFTGTELDALKEELLHFQNRLKKLQYFNGQLDQKNEKILNMDQQERIKLLKHAQNRVNELDGHVKKLNQHLEQKILNRHTEL